MNAKPGRKLWLTLMAVAVFVGMFLLLLFKGAYTEGALVTLVGAIVGILSAFFAANVASKGKYNEHEKIKNGGAGGA